MYNNIYVYMYMYIYIYVYGSPLELSTSFGVNTVYSLTRSLEDYSVCAYVYTLNPAYVYTLNPSVCVCVFVFVFRAMRAVPMHPEF